MNFDKLRIFYKTAILSSYEKAAENLKIPSAHVEQAIEDLESTLRVFLFFKEDNRVLLTTQGHFLYRKARIILQECDSINYSFTECGDDLKGLLTISSTSGLASLWLPQYLKRFLNENPNLSIELIVDDKETDSCMRKADIAIRPWISASENITQHYLMTWHVGLYATPKYLAEFGTPKTIEELKNHRLLAWGEQVFSYQKSDWLLYLGRTEAELPTSPYLRIGSVNGLIECALDGMGIVSLSEELSYVRRGKFVRVLPEIQGPAVDIFYSYPSFLEMSKRILAFRDYITLQIGKRVPFKSEHITAHC